jgi:diguanylate cyclase (GGDEF)-like protein/PAS domain S-box-containing protein
VFQAKPAEVLEKLTATAAKTMQVQRVGFWRLDAGGSRLTSANNYDAHLNRHESGIELAHEQYPAYFSAILNNCMVVADDARKHPMTREFSASYLEPLGIGAMLDVPVKLFGRTLGVLCFEHVGGPRRWREDERFFALSMANLIAAAYEHDERRQAEISLRLAATAFETSEGIIITAPDTTILRVNRAACAITGYEADELVGAKTNIFKSGRQNREFYRSMWDRLLKDGRWEGELWNRRRSGEIFPQWISINAVRDQAGAITNYVSTFLDISERKLAEEEIARLAHFDTLTGLPNRRLILDRLNHAFLTCQRQHRHGVLMFVDLDHFKHLNDALGHSAGDHLLAQVGERLRQLMRQTDSVGRLGGDEFLVLLSTFTESSAAAVHEAEQVAAKILNGLGRPFELEGQLYHLGASIGVAIFPDGCLEASDALKQADTAMYRAKESSRNTVRFFEASMQAAAEKRLELERALRAALSDGELSLHFQPQVAADGQLAAAEVLTRWYRPGHGWIPPAVFIPIAEESGLITVLGGWVLNRACQAIHRMEQEGRACDVAVNVSPRQFRQADFVDQVRSALTAGRAAPHHLVLELTENAVLDDLDEAAGKMTALRELGVRFSIDDFGTGYSSLAYLRRLPVSEIKIDRSFVADVITDPGDAAIVDAILAMAQRLGLKAVAEGVETAEQVRFLDERGCRYFQGYYYGAALPWDDFLELELVRTHHRPADLAAIREGSPRGVPALAELVPQLSESGGSSR